MKNWMPTTGEVAREAIIVVGGAILAAAVIGMFPSIKQWIKDQWKA